MQWFEKKAVHSVGFGVLFALVAGATIVYFGRPGRPVTIRVGYGEGAPVRKDFLDNVAAGGKKHNLDIRVVTTKGTDDTVNLIDRHELDLGLVVGAIEDRGAREIVEIMPLYLEPLQLLVKDELYEAVSKDFGQLRGKTIDLDSEESATRLVSDELLKFIGLNDPVTGKPDYTPVFIPQMRLHDLTGSAEMPDAVFQLAGVPSPTIRSMIVDHDYRLVPLPFGNSFNLDRFHDLNPSDAKGTSLRLDTTLVEEYVIPAFAYRVLPPVPAIDTRTVAAPLTLLGSPALSNDVVARLLDTILSPDISSLTKPPLAPSLLESDFQFDRHPGTDAYVASQKPLDIEGWIGSYSSLVELWGFVVAGWVGLTQAWKWWRGRKGAFAGKSVGDFLGQVLAVEADARADCSEQARITLDQRLSDIKKHAIELHLEGDLEDADNFPALMVTLADTRTRIWRPTQS
jgi:TRAP-type uncharacterized transport system substrate-binding protein